MKRSYENWHGIGADDTQGCYSSLPMIVRQIT
jgi:hypothetical protein